MAADQQCTNRSKKEKRGTSWLVTCRFKNGIVERQNMTGNRSIVAGIEALSTMVHEVRQSAGEIIPRIPMDIVGSEGSRPEMPIALFCVNMILISRSHGDFDWRLV